MNNDYTNWVKGISYEVAFWNSYYRNKHRRQNLFDWSQYNRPCELDDFDIDDFIARSGDSNPIIIDAGCALSYAFGNIINGVAQRIDYVDALAPFYNRILERYHIDMPLIKFGMVESLSTIYAANSATFIHIRNALDHAANPIEGIIQSLVCLKVGGVLYLNHYINEAETESYRGFHRFNISETDGKLIIWNKTEHIDVADRLRECATVKVSVTPQKRVVAVVTKVAQVPDTMYSLRDTSYRMAEMTMNTVTYYHSFQHSLRYQISRLYCFIGHNIMRLMPLAALRFIKSIARK
jgi:hypothetical protein